MIRTLDVQHFVTVHRFIDPQYAEYLNRKWVKHCKRVGNGGDNQIDQSQSQYNYLPFVDLLIEKTSHMNEIVGERVLPTYCYARNYLNGAELKPHTDRPACEVSVTLHLGGDMPWSFFIKSSTNMTHQCDLKPGDAVVYLGMRGQHWRPPFNGTQYGQVFMHYVTLDGPNTQHLFDREKLREGSEQHL